MKRTKILYWVFTGLTAALMLSSGIQNIMKNDDSVKLIVTTLGYPMYFLPIVGWAKVLGVIGILVPGYYRIKEWAYAGLVFDVTAATLSSIAVGEIFIHWWPMLFFIGLPVASYYFYRKLEGLTINNSLNTK